MTISAERLYLRTGDRETVYLKHVVSDPMIEVGDCIIIMTLSMPHGNL